MLRWTWKNSCAALLLVEKKSSCCCVVLLSSTPFHPLTLLPHFSSYSRGRRSNRCWYISSIWPWPRRLVLYTYPHSTIVHFVFIFCFIYSPLIEKSHWAALLPLYHKDVYSTFFFPMPLIPREYTFSRSVRVHHEEFRCVLEEGWWHSMGRRREAAPTDFRAIFSHHHLKSEQTKKRKKNKRKKKEAPHLFFLPAPVR